MTEKGLDKVIHAHRERKKNRKRKRKRLRFTVKRFQLREKRGFKKKRRILE